MRTLTVLRPYGAERKVCCITKFCLCAYGLSAKLCELLRGATYLLGPVDAEHNVSTWSVGRIDLSGMMHITATREGPSRFNLCFLGPYRNFTIHTRLGNYCKKWSPHFLQICNQAPLYAFPDPVYWSYMYNSVFCYAVCAVRPGPRYKFCINDFTSVVLYVWWAFSVESYRVESICGIMLSGVHFTF